jgi:hypothetical protein
MFLMKYVNHYLNMLVTRCLKVIMPSKHNTSGNIFSKLRLLGHYHLIKPWSLAHSSR